MASGYFCLIARCCCIIGVSVPAFAIDQWDAGTYSGNSGKGDKNKELFM